MKENNRISYLGLLKFIASLAIIFYHSMTTMTSHWGGLYALVEFFIFITGYFTFRHFRARKDEIRKNPIEKKATNALKYSINKISKLMPFVVVSVILIFVINVYYARYQDPRTILLILKTVPADLLLMHSQTPDSVNAIWYISALAITLPVFVYFAKQKSQKLYY